MSDEKPQSVQCARCKKHIDSEFDPRDSICAGFYWIGPGSMWNEFAKPGEEFICDECLWTSPEYIAKFGVGVIS